MNAKTFVDTNILVYAYDSSTPSKREIAKNILTKLWGERTGALSVQVLQEFYVTVTRKIPKPLTTSVAQEIVASYASWCGETSAAEVTAAFRIESQSRIGYWDALIVASAAKAGAVRLFSEDLNAGQVIGGVQIENPFAKTA